LGPRLAWPLGDAAALQSLDAWIVEAAIDLEHLRAQPVGPRLDLRLRRVEHARAEIQRSRWGVLPRRTILPVCAWSLSIDGLREWEIDIAEDQVEFTVKHAAGGAGELRIEGVDGGLSLSGGELLAEALLLGDTELEAVRLLGFQYLRTRTERT
jgi:hypothetical protein